jgi:hypothetical protein
VIDEWYDRTYRESRADLNDALGRLFDVLALRIRTPPSVKTGETAIACPIPQTSLAVAALPLMGAAPTPSSEPLSLAGTWAMESAYEIHADGTRHH